MRYYLKFFTPAVLLLCIVYSFRYKTEKITDGTSGIAFYHFFHIRDTTNIGRIWEEDFQMKFNNQRSLYTSYTKQIQDSIREAKIEAADKAGSEIINMGVVRPTTLDNIYISENTLYINKNFNENNYLIKEALEKIDWKIEKETKLLLGYTCQKATGVCKGRFYTVWFTTDVPVSFGPWKLHGLPGLILEAYDTSQRIKFTCTKIKLDAAVSGNTSLRLPQDAIATTYTEYNRMEKAYRESLGSNESNGNGMTIDKVSVIGNSQGKSPKRITLNYPLELTN